MPNTFYSQGEEAFKKQDYQAAKDLFLQAVNDGCNEPECYFLLGKSYFFCDEKGLAIEHLNKFIGLIKTPVSQTTVELASDAYNLIGQCHESLNEGNLSVKCYYNAVCVSPQNAAAWHNFGMLRLKTAQRGLKEDNFKTEQVIADNLVELHSARECFENALKHCKTDLKFLHSMANWCAYYATVLRKIENAISAAEKDLDHYFEQSIEYYQKTLAAWPENERVLKSIITSNFSECFAQYGHRALKAGNREKAKELYLKAIRLDPNQQNAISADTWLNIACEYRLSNLLNEAERALVQAKKFAAPDNRDIAKEEEQLRIVKSQNCLITSANTLFASLNSAPRSESRTSIDDYLAAIDFS